MPEVGLPGHPRPASPGDSAASHEEESLSPHTPFARRRADPKNVDPPKAKALPFLILVFLGSFLLFQIELILGRLLLPKFGSSASVWTTCLMFYQGALFLGYLYAGHAARRIARRRYQWLHLLLVAVPVAFFPLHILRFDLPPIASILATLSIAIGAPFIALSTTSIVAQAWFTRTNHPQHGDPYFLYGASNAGALAALATYPFVIEPNLGMKHQLLLWYLLYIAFVLFHVWCLRQLPRDGDGEPSEASAAEASGVEASGVEEEGHPTWRMRTYWTLLAGGGSALLMAVTNVVTMDAPVPLLWVLPLMVYLITLIVTFSRKPIEPATVTRVGFMSLGLILICLFCIVVTIHIQLAFVLMHNLILLIGCLLCHSSLSRSRPRDTRHLGVFYLHLSLGGWLGALVIGIVMPVLFYKIADYIVDYLAAGGLILTAFLLHDLEGWSALIRRRPLRGGLAIVGIVLVMGLLAAGIRLGAATIVDGARTFYGLYTVKDDEGIRRFHHGNTVHGVEDLSNPGEPMAYFHRDSPIGRLLSSPHLELKRVGIVGLGAGSLAAYERPDQRWDYYEIDPEVERIARMHFTFLDRAVAPTRIIIGDARLSLERVAPRTYDLLVMDTFSSDFVPLHLITEEALRLYLSVIEEDGLLVFHITNRIFDFVPVLSRMGEDIGVQGYVAGGMIPGWTGPSRGLFASRWYAFTKNSETAAVLKGELGWEPAPAAGDDDAVRAWTDDYINLFDAIRF